MVRGLTEAVIELRTYVEAAIDFPEEEIDFLADRELGERYEAQEHFDGVMEVPARAPAARGHGRGAHPPVRAGNAGKSSLLNRLAAGYGEQSWLLMPGTACAQREAHPRG